MTRFISAAAIGALCLISGCSKPDPAKTLPGNWQAGVPAGRQPDNPLVIDGAKRVGEP